MDVNYKAIYYALVYSRQNLQRRKANDGMLEDHHIWPRSLGGSNRAENRVLLTPREHFIAHLLLVKFLEGKEKAKMVFALHMMTRSNPNQNRITTSAQYETVKQLLRSGAVKGQNHPNHGRRMWSNEQRFQISERMTGSKNHRFQEKSWNSGLTKETSAVLKRVGEQRQQAIASGTLVLKGWHQSEDAKQKVSAAQKGNPKSAAHREKISNSLKGRKVSPDVVEKTASVLRGSKQMTTVCPKCGKIGAVSAMKRWHFNACRVPG